jgi:hypothetical protein
MSKNRFGIDFTRMPRVYVAGKLNDDAVGYIKNMGRMMRYAEALNSIGFASFVPALDFLMGLKFNYVFYENYFDVGQPFLLASHAVFVCPGWESSSGTKKEIALAEENGIPVFYAIDDLVRYVNEREDLEIYGDFHPVLEEINQEGEYS